jgi:hypothetical protein
MMDGSDTQTFSIYSASYSIFIANTYSWYFWLFLFKCRKVPVKWSNKYYHGNRNDNKHYSRSFKYVFK